MVYLVEFELYPDEEGITGTPYDFEGSVRGADWNEAVHQATAWARKMILEELTKGHDIPAASLGNVPRAGGRSVVIAVDINPREIESLSTAEAAARLNVSVARISQMCSSGLLLAYKEHGRLWISRASVEDRLAHPARSGRPRGRTVTTGRQRHAAVPSDAASEDSDQDPA
ncbi:helix-turn-helix domain-containing protein [Eggerthellaceae bacterium zg-997]|nr:helix-turn-helix domain-containing protein [Eggerthellaceae bacterium zg-997]